MRRAATLAKADITTEMVGEFPSLQGVMGEKYSLLTGEDPEVAAAIFSHYLPRHADDILPGTTSGPWWAWPTGWTPSAAASGWV